MSEVKDDYGWWRSALANGVKDVDPNTPQCGFYKTKRDGAWQPVAIWNKNGTLVCRIASAMVDPIDVWTFCAKNPVSKEAGKHAFETGLFPGDIAPVGNNMAALPTAEQIALTIEDITKWLDSIGGKIKTDIEKDTAAKWRDKLNGLKSTADAEHEAEKRPILDAGYAIDAKFKPAIKAADATVKTIRDALTVYLNAEQKRRDDAAKAAHEAEVKRVAAERAKIAAEQAQQLRDDPIAAMTSPPPAEPELPMFVPAPKVQAGGQSGKKTSLRTVTRYVVTDYAKALAHVQDHPDVRAAVEKVAAAQFKAGTIVPGVEKVEEKVAA